MTFHTVSYLTKSYSESFEEIDPGVIEALARLWRQLVADCFPGCLADLSASNSVLDFHPVRNQLFKCRCPWVLSSRSRWHLVLILFMAGSHLSRLS